MQLKIREVLAKAEPIQLHLTFDMADLLKDRQDIAGFGMLKADLTAAGRSGVADVEGRLNLSVELVCSRCLGPVKEDLDIPFRESFTQKPELIPSGGEEEEVHLVTDDIDLKTYVEEAVWLALPFTPLCKEDCLGLCPVCGRNRNEQDCGCSTAKVDPRLAGLADFFNDDKK
jgi:uncharacterized protein